MSFPVAGVKVLRNRQALNYADCAIRQNLAGPNLRRQHSVRADYLSMDNIYTDSDTSITDVNQIIGVFDYPDQGLDDGILKKPVSALNVALSEIPKFLEDLCDNLQSLAHLEYFLHKLSPNIMII